MQDVLTVISLGSIYLLFALGMSLTWGTIDILNFAHGSIFMFAAFTGYLVLQETALAAGPDHRARRPGRCAMSLIIQVLAFEQIIKRARDKRTAEMQILIGGIGVAIIPLAIAQDYTKSNPFGLEQVHLRRHRVDGRGPPDHQHRRPDRRRGARPVGAASPSGCAAPATGSRCAPSASTPRSPR